MQAIEQGCKRVFYKTKEFCKTGLKASVAKESCGKFPGSWGWGNASGDYKS